MSFLPDHDQGRHRRDRPRRASAGARHRRAGRGAASLTSAITVREFTLEDLDGAAGLGERLRAQDPAVEPFSQRLGIVATGPRALLELWRVAEDESGLLHGIAFAALREAKDARLDVYAAVAPELRRQGLGRTLLEPVLSLGDAVLRARVRDTHQAGRAFLGALGFVEVSAQLSLSWPGHPKPELPEMPALSIREAAARDQSAVARLSSEAWAGAPDSFATRADEIAQLFAEQGRLVLLAESEKRPLGYLSAVRLGRALGIEEVAVLPQFRRMGVGRALVAAALARDAASAVLSVGEDNLPARALYRSLGFTQSARRMVMERRNG